MIVMALVGGLIAAQPAINSTLGRATGGIAAAFVSFLIGTVVLAVLVVLSGQTGGLGGAFEVQPIYLLGGVLGAAYVFTALVVVREVGAGGVAAATITGQLSFSVLLDRFGVLGLSEIPVSADRVLGIALLLVGTFLIVR